MSEVEDDAPKAVVQGYAPRPFFFAQTSPQGSIRRVAWTGDLPQLKRLVYAILRHFTANALVLMKVGKEDVADGPVWTRYHGEAPLAKVIQAMQANERMVFQDGYTQLCVRDADTGDYIALDEHGVLYIYSDDPVFAQICTDSGLSEREEALISEHGHWRRALDNADDLQHRFISALGLQQVE
jgi:hypothetical protein